MAFFKAMAMGALVTGVFALIVGSTGSSAGWLAIHTLNVAEYGVQWSWPLFVAMTGLAWVLLLMQR